MVARLGNKPGKMRLGCLLSIFVLVAGIYVGIDVLEVYWRYYRLQDYVKEQAGFAPIISNDVIRRRLVAYSDTLGVPVAARAWDIRRSASPREITVSAQYQDSVVVKVLGLRKVWYVDFRPNARAHL